MITMIINYEVTDTFGGEANYSWVKRGRIQLRDGEEISDLAIVRRVKKEIDWQGIKCKKESYSDDIVLRPVGMCQVCFITFHYFGSAS